MRKAHRKPAIILAVLLMLAAPLSAQIFIMDDEFEGKLRQNVEAENLLLPITALDSDQTFSPVGEGAWLLTVLGGAYLLAKRKRPEERK